MQAVYMPRLGWRYWLALYAHAGLPGIGPAVFAAETRDRLRREARYWRATVVIRTGAPNVADLLAYRLRTSAPRRGHPIPHAAA